MKKITAKQRREFYSFLKRNNIPRATSYSDKTMNIIIKKAYNEAYAKAKRKNLRNVSA